MELQVRRLRSNVCEKLTGRRARLQPCRKKPQHAFASLCLHGITVRNRTSAAKEAAEKRFVRRARLQPCRKKPQHRGLQPLRYAFPSLYLHRITLKNRTSAAKEAAEKRFVRRAQLQPCRKKPQHRGLQPLRYAFPSLYLHRITLKNRTSAAKATPRNTFTARLKPCPSYSDFSADGGAKPRDLRFLSPATKVGCPIQAVLWLEWDKRILKSRRLLCVGPVTRVSPSAVNSG